MSLESVKEANEMFEKYDGKKVLIANGKLFKTNAKSTSNQYYKLIGEAYSANNLDRVILAE